MKRVTKGSAVALSAVVTTAGSLAGIAGTSAAAQGAKVTINAVLPNGTGSITSQENAGLASLTKSYEAAHRNVTVNWIPNTASDITSSNAALVTEASGGAAPDLVWEQYAATTALPSGLLQDLKPWLDKPNPYVAGNKSWLSLFSPSTIPYMTSTNGGIYIVLGSDVETGMFYNKADFSKAGISSAPATWAQFVADLAKLKSSGVTPLLFADGGSCNPSWYERLVTSSLLQDRVKSFDVNDAPVATALDLAVGIHEGIISMSNPAYAEVWKLLGQLSPYLYSGGSSYDACSEPSAASPPLNPESLLVQGKVAVEWGGSWWIPQLAQAGFSAKYGVFPEPTITKQSTPYALGTVTTGLIGGPNGPGQWSVTSEKADRSMTAAKTAVVINFLAWLFTPQHLGYFINVLGSGADIPTETASPTAALPSLKTLLPSKSVPVVVLPLTTGLLEPSSADAAVRLMQEYISSSVSYNQFSSQWQSLLTTSAEQWASQNHVNLAKY